MSIEQNIVHAIEISKVTKIPVLLMSNPGLGKTTILKRYSHHYGYHLETLIGSRFTPEEISGYQVNNGGDHLQHLNPEWFNRILQKAKEGKRTLLFIDELSTCSEFVQGALLSLIFDRTIGNGKFLPDSCFIVAAANYAGNLPQTMSLMAPTLNRFVLINLNDNYNALDMVQEFLKVPAPVHYPEAFTPLSESQLDKFMENFRSNWNEIFIKYSNPKGSQGLIDISNRALDNLYSKSSGSVYNFISGRTLSYLSRVIIAYNCLGISNADILTKMIDGLVGAGSCQFETDIQGTKYRELVHSALFKMVNLNKNATPTFLPLVHEISKDIAAYMTNVQNPSFTQQYEIQQLIDIAHQITSEFTDEKIIQQCATRDGKAKFITHYDSVTDLLNTLEKLNKSQNIIRQLRKTCYDYYSFYCELTGVPHSFKNKFGITINPFKKVVIVRLKTANNVYKYGHAAFAIQSNGRALFLIDPKQLVTEVSPSLENSITDTNIDVLEVVNGKLSYSPLVPFLRNLRYQR